MTRWRHVIDYRRRPTNRTNNTVIPVRQDERLKFVRGLIVVLSLRWASNTLINMIYGPVRQYPNGGTTRLSTSIIRLSGLYTNVH